MMRYVLIGLILSMGVLAYVRFAPSNPARWHVPLTFDRNDRFPQGVERVISDADEATLAQLHDIILAEPAAVHFEGSLAQGHVTYIVRSKWIGFPDYVTVQLTDGTLRIYARLRFGHSDLGVNFKRVRRWLAQLEKA